MTHRYRFANWKLVSQSGTNCGKNFTIRGDVGEASYAAVPHLVRLALKDLGGAKDSLLVRSLLSVVALGRGERQLGALLNYVESDEIASFVEEHLAWSELYVKPTGEASEDNSSVTAHLAIFISKSLDYAWTQQDS